MMCVKTRALRFAMPRRKTTTLSPWSRARHETADHDSLASGVLAVALVGTAIAGPFEDGQVAYRRDDYPEALRLWGQLADQGNARAQFSLGKMYYIGQGVLRDNAKADAWYRKAADQGFDYAQFNLGVAYEDGGLGVPQDYALAHMWSNWLRRRNQHRPSPNGSRKSR